MKVFLTFLITSLLWIGGYYIYTEVIPKQEDIMEQSSSVDYSDDIIGKWTPVEEAKYKLEFSKYGIFKQCIDILGVEIPKEFPYQVNKDIVIITQDDENIDFPITIYTNESGTFLEIRDITQLSGKYKKVVSKPKNATKPKTQQQKQQPRTEKPKVPAKNYAELICGYWEPVEGTTSKLDISKYGTVTRYYKINNGSHWYDDRKEYSISSNKLIVDDYYKCTVNVFEENGATYLEVYGHENYAGKYRLRK